MGLWYSSSFSPDVPQPVQCEIRLLLRLKTAGKLPNAPRGYLVLPNVGKDALIVGFEYSRGALRVGGKTVEYYSMATGSLGLQIGGEAKDIIISYNKVEPVTR